MGKSGNSKPSLGQCLRAWRNAAGFTQEQLADKSGINRVSIAKIELDTQKPTFATMQALATALGTTIDALTTSLPKSDT